MSHARHGFVGEIDWRKAMTADTFALCQKVGEIESKCGAFYLFIANFLATQIIGGAKELVVLLQLSGNI